MISFIDGQELYDNLDNDNLIILDCRFDISNPSGGYTLYQQGHLPHAIFFNPEQTLSLPPSKIGGRHPYPDINKLQITVAEYGLKREMSIVAYGTFAPRLVFLLQELQFSNVKMLNGGIQAWKEENLPLETTINTPTPTQPEILPIKYQNIVDFKFVEDHTKDNSIVLIDSRSQDRFKGISEPIDSQAGTIPKAINFFWKDAYDTHNSEKIKKDIKLREHFIDIISINKPIVIFCGSGVTACFNYLALKEIGINTSIYIGSWSDWINHR